MRIGLMDKLAGTAILKRHRNAMAAMDESEAEDKHKRLMANMKRKKQMVAMRKSKYVNSLADSE